RVAEATPDLAAAWSEVGAAFFRAHDTASAAEAFQTAVDLDPENAEAWFNLGNVRESSGRSEDAIECYRRATDIRPAFVKAHNNLGFVLNGLDRLDDAVLSYEAALREDPNNTDALTNMGNAWREQGNLDAALEHYEKALETDPACANAHGNILLTEHARPGATPAGILARHLEWDARHGAPLQQSWPDHGNRADPDRRLKVGLVSADFGRHPVGYFTIGFFENHDPTELELTGYCGRSPDPMTERFIKAAGHWVDIRGMTDADLAERVRADGIDILFDLSGHTTNHRLACFARKPAPVQISWSGYPGTTGLRAMDYLVSDSVHTAAGDDDAHAERLIRMPASFISYTAPDGVPDVGPLPRLENGLVTFGCFSNPAKINADLLARWARIMRRLPDSRLVMTYQHLDAAENRRRIQETLAGHGIDASRVEIGGRRDPMELISGYNGIDIAFDTHPYSGGATTCEAIWMGVPVLTLPGST
ncbi:MAG: tetratricopeptide repeat protein, partial [Magnetovibrio sp.]|nr:tetratricopeptide repeat protein [Magnetovibrio sp.]